MSTLSSKSNKTIRAALALSLAAALPVSAVLTPAPAVAAEGDLDRAVTALRGISTMKADFVQTDRSGQTVRGVMTLKRPGKIRFEYEKGVPMLVVSNGKSMYMVDYEVNQVQRWPSSNSPLGALLDPSRDVKRY
ncbi:MAG TPA: cell envelope biogenesis protein LolA, partial [Erythrobacter sp.]|nr:cell envelope biogenesis protein LolA [Erythrobacter sp.]